MPIAPVSRPGGLATGLGIIDRVSQQSAARLEEVARPQGRDLRITQLVGNTPLLRIHLIEDECPGVELYGKAEFLNPGGSVKDRPALRMIEEAERSGALTRDRIILDSTSGNTGIAYAMGGAAKGYRVRLVMATNVSEVRKHMVEA